MLKMLKINVKPFYIKADKNDQEDLKERIFIALQEAMENDELEYHFYEVDEEESEFLDDCHDDDY